MSLDQGYVGVTNRPLDRFEEHKKSRYNPYLMRALKRHKENIQFVILDIFTSREEAHWLEYTLRPNKNIGWNIAVGGSTPPAWKGRSHTDTTRQKMSAAAKGKVISKEQRTAISKKLSGVKLSPDRLAKLRHNNGADHHGTKLCNIYEYGTDKLIAENVSVNQWANQNGVAQSALSLTAKVDLSKPFGAKNRRQTKGVYAKYV